MERCSPQVSCAAGGGGETDGSNPTPVSSRRVAQRWVALVTSATPKQRPLFTKRSKKPAVASARSLYLFTPKQFHVSKEGKWVRMGRNSYSFSPVVPPCVAPASSSDLTNALCWQVVASKGSKSKLQPLAYLPKAGFAPSYARLMRRRMSPSVESTAQIAPRKLSSAPAPECSMVAFRIAYDSSACTEALPQNPIARSSALVCSPPADEKTDTPRPMPSTRSAELGIGSEHGPGLRWAVR